MSIVRNPQVELAIKKRFGNKFKLSQINKLTSYQVCCPFCIKEVGKVDKQFKLYITPDKGIYHCFRCGAAGGIYKLFDELSKTKLQNIVIQEDVTELKESTSEPGVLVRPSELDATNPIIGYLRSRGYDPCVLEDVWGIRACTRGCLFGGVYDTTDTVIFPVWMDNRLVGWQSRLIYEPDKIKPEDYAWKGFQKDEDGEYKIPPKYFTSPGLNKGRILFNYDQARQFKLVVVCEGTFDAISVGPMAVATFGKGVTEQQTKLLQAYWDCVVILLDPGDADSDTFKLYKSLSSAVKAVPINLKGYKDAGEAPQAEIWNQIIDTMIKMKINPGDYLNDV